MSEPHLRVAVRTAGYGKALRMNDADNTSDIPCNPNPTCGSDGKGSACNAGEPSSTLGLRRSLGVGNGNLLRYSCLENPMDRVIWQTTVHGVAELDTTEWLRNLKVLLLLSPHLSPHSHPCSNEGFHSKNATHWTDFVAVVQLPSYVRLFVTPWTAACQAPLSSVLHSSVSQSLLKFMFIESGMLSNHLILCCPLLLLPSIFPSIRVFSNESIQQKCPEGPLHARSPVGCFQSYYLFKTILFYWGTTDLQYCVGFCCAAQLFSHTHTHIIFSFMVYCRILDIISCAIQ